MNVLLRILCLPVMLVLQACLIVIFIGHCFYSVYQWLICND